MIGHSRRGALTALGGAAAALIADHAPLLAAARAGAVGGWTPGLQLYTLGDAPARDLPGTLRTVRQVGFTRVELPGDYGHTPAALREALDAAGLTCSSVHVAPLPTPGMWDLQDDIEQLIGHLHQVGATYLVVPIVMFPESMVQAIRNPPPGGFDAAARDALFDTIGVDDWRRTADLLNARATRLLRAGIRTAYHNHALDFRPLAGGRTGYDVLVENTDPKLVKLELDIGWAVSAGQDLDGLFRRLGARIALLHFKDVQRPSGPVLDMVPADIGAGIVPWKSVAAWMARLNIDDAFIEQEPPFPHAPMESVRIGYRYLSDLFGHSRRGRP